MVSTFAYGALNPFPATPSAGVGGKCSLLRLPVSKQSIRALELRSVGRAEVSTRCVTVERSFVRAENLSRLLPD